jgi:prophage regulatory protein
MMTFDPPATAPAPAPVRRRPAAAQPLGILYVPGGLLTLATVMQVTSMRKSKIYAMIREGKFPEQIRISTRSVRWRAEEILAWLSRQRPRSEEPAPAA